MVGSISFFLSLLVTMCGVGAGVSSSQLGGGGRSGEVGAGVVVGEAEGPHAV